MPVVIVTSRVGDRWAKGMCMQSGNTPSAVGYACSRASMSSVRLTLSPLHRNFDGLYAFSH
jgi:hypothetical protein